MLNLNVPQSKTSMPIEPVWKVTFSNHVTSCSNTNSVLFSGSHLRQVWTRHNLATADSQGVAKSRCHSSYVSSTIHTAPLKCHHDYSLDLLILSVNLFRMLPLSTL